MLIHVSCTLSRYHAGGLSMLEHTRSGPPFAKSRCIPRTGKPQCLTLFHQMASTLWNRPLLSLCPTPTPQNRKLCELSTPGSETSACPPKVLAVASKPNNSLRAPHVPRLMLHAAVPWPKAGSVVAGSRLWGFRVIKPLESLVTTQYG